jgi:hypothetical protein
MCVFAVALGMIALVVPSVFLVSTNSASADDSKNVSGQGTSTANRKPAANADSGLGIFGILFARSGAGAYASGAAGPPPHTTAPGGDRGVAATFESLSRQQQVRVMQRCKEVLAAPAEADANQISLCQTLNLTAGR